VAVHVWYAGQGAAAPATGAAIHDTGTVTVKSKTITVKELTVREIINLAKNKALLGTSSKIKEDEFELDALRELADEMLPQFLEGATMDELLDMKPSQLKEIYAKFMEVNSTFFAVARSVGLHQIVEQLKLALQKDFLKLLADL
jgi:formate-dependent phosphoribosylglycinamide formyltransferase (GAR transformylase)